MNADQRDKLLDLHRKAMSAQLNALSGAGSYGEADTADDGFRDYLMSLPSEAPPEIRYATLINGKTELDEVVARNAMVHLEAMDDNHWWMAITSGGKEVHVNLSTKRAKIHAIAEEEPA